MVCLLSPDFLKKKSHKDFYSLRPDIDRGLFNASCLLPARASEQGNVIGLVSVYIYICTKLSSKKNCN